MVKPPPGLVTSYTEVASRAISTASRGGASKLARPALKFQRPIRPQARNISSGTASSSPELSFVQLLYQGVFTSVKSAAIPRPGPYTGQRLAARPPPPFRQGFSSSSAARARPQGSRFGPTPRPTVYPTQTSQLGLGAARKFSSSGYAVFENFVHNAPLALRALADQGKDGLDDRKWRQIRREIRKNEKTDVKGKGAIEGQRLKENVGIDFAEYFSTPARSVEPLTLLLVLDPEVPFASTSSSPVPSSSAPLQFDASYRLLSSSVLSVLRNFTESYSSHANRLRNVVNKLSAAGLLDDPSKLEEGIYLDTNTGKRIWKVTFLDGFLTRGRLEAILRSDADPADSMTWETKVKTWNGSNPRLGNGEGGWWMVQGGSCSSQAHTDASSIDLDDFSDPAPLDYFGGPLEATFFQASSASSPCASQATFEDEDGDQPQSLILPDPSSLEFSPPLSPSLEPTLWTSFHPSSPQYGFRGPEVQDFDAIESWSRGIEDEDSREGASGWDSSSASVVEVSEEEGTNAIEQFLGEIDRERERVGASCRR